MAESVCPTVVVVCIDGIMNTEVYRGMLDANLWNSVKKLFKRQKWIFLQDNDAKQSSHLLKEDVPEP